MKNPKDRIREIENRLEQLPKGTLTYKTINGKKQPYVQSFLHWMAKRFRYGIVWVIQKQQ